MHDALLHPDFFVHTQVAYARLVFDYCGNSTERVCPCCPEACSNWLCAVRMVALVESALVGARESVNGLASPETSRDGHFFLGCANLREERYLFTGWAVCC